MTLVCVGCGDGEGVDPNHCPLLPLTFPSRTWFINANQLSGTLPASYTGLTFLSSFNAVNNYLSGTVPAALVSTLGSGVFQSNCFDNVFPRTTGVVIACPTMTATPSPSPSASPYPYFPFVPAAVPPTPTWTLVWSNNGTAAYDAGETATNALMNALPLFMRTCSNCLASHTTVFYRRLTPIGAVSPYALMTSYWGSANNLLNTDFQLFSSLTDLQAGTNPWQVPAAPWTMACHGGGVGSLCWWWLCLDCAARRKHTKGISCSEELYGEWLVGSVGSLCWCAMSWLCCAAACPVSYAAATLRSLCPYHAPPPTASFSTHPLSL